VEKRRKIQHELVFEGEGRGEAPRASEEGIESTAVKLGTESQANTDKLIEEACEKENLKEALRRVKANAGAAGVDGMTVKELPDFLRENWPRLKEQLLARTYRPQPVRRVEIPKSGGDTRKLGWRGYFGFCQTPSILKELEGWTRRRLRCVIWKQWKRGPVRFKELRLPGIGITIAAQTAGSAHGPWRLSNSPALDRSLPKAFFNSFGLSSLAT